MHLTWLINQITGRQGVPCLFHLLTGFYCPGCGGTRAVRLLLMGDVAGSFRYHPFVPYMAVVLLAEVLLFTGSILAGFRIKKEQGKPAFARRDTKKNSPVPEGPGKALPVLDCSGRRDCGNQLAGEKCAAGCGD